MSELVVRDYGIALEELCQRYRALYGGPIYDVLERMGLPNQVLHHSIKPIRPDMVLAGAAVTVKAVMRPPVPNEVTYNPVDFVYPGAVIVYSSEEQVSAHFGELTGHACAAKGAVGVVVDGGLRDSTKQIQIDRWRPWAAFCRYTSPIELAARQRIVSVNQPVFMSGSLTAVVEVRPGDFIFGDLDGVIVIPFEKALEVLEQAEDIVKREGQARDELKKGTPFSEVGRRFGVG
ncbi:MAG: hypothetical protein NZ959_02825 [Armatimonadetes bacterium]|nr:hypothetical protein [Armatimonadota bacterium]MDW8121487.1 hypothetical protein [Armatimonadota bacterium]